MSSMKLGEQNVIMTEHPTDEKTQFLLDVLNKYDPTYNEVIRLKGGLAKMMRIDIFFLCPNHSKMTSWGMEFMLCGEAGCNL